MARKHVVTTLERKYARLLGHQAKIKYTSLSLVKDMAHIEAVIRLFEPLWDRDCVKPIMYRGESRWAKKGQGSRAAIEVMKKAAKPLSATEIARAAYLECGMEPPGNDELRLVGTDLIYSLRRQFAGQITMIEGRPRRWMLAATRPPAANIPSTDATPAMP